MFGNLLEIQKGIVEQNPRKTDFLASKIKNLFLKNVEDHFYTWKKNQHNSKPTEDKYTLQYHIG